MGACFAWLVTARHLAGKPWRLVNRRTGDDRQADEMASRTFAPALWALVLAPLEALAATEPAAELLDARLGDLQRLDTAGGHTLLLQVSGKGSKNRVIPLEVVGQLLGHADPRTTAKNTRAQLRRVSEQIENAFGQWQDAAALLAPPP